MLKERKFMAMAAEEACKGVNSNEGGPFGATIVIGNEVLSNVHNMVVSNGDPTGHAEVTAIRKAIEYLKNNNRSVSELSKAQIYSSCEPCPMCLAAIAHAGIKELYIGATREDAKKAGFDDSFIYDVFSNKAEKKQINLNIKNNLDEFIKNEYGLTIDTKNSQDKAWLIKVDRDKNGKVLHAEVVTTGIDDYAKTEDPTSYPAINAIRSATLKNKNFDLSSYELVSTYRPGPLTYATMHWAKLTKVHCGAEYEPNRGVSFKGVLDTINGVKGKSLITTKSVARDLCLKAFKEWEKKNDKVAYLRILPKKANLNVNRPQKRESLHLGL